jgi:hypothetical protein
MPPVPPSADMGVGCFEHFRRVRRTKKRLWKLFNTFDYSKAWAYLNGHARQGDIVSGHFMYGAPVLPDWELRYITIVREPVSRLYSEYRYCRQSFFERPYWRRSYLAGRLKVAGRGDFRDYVKYLHSHVESFANPLVGYITGGVEVGDAYDFLRQQYFHYGTLERMDLFADGLSAKLGSPVIPVWKNKTARVPAIEADDVDRDHIDALIGKDIELYKSIRDERK